MNFGRNRYEKQIEKLGIKLSSVVNIEEERTYKKFVNVTITYEDDGIEKKKNFRVIQQKVTEQEL